MESVAIIIPAYNEEDSIEHVIKDLPSNSFHYLIVVDNNSTDNTSAIATKNNATVLFEKHPGYGSACLKGIEYLKSLQTPPSIVVFLDADYSDHSNEITQLTNKINEGYDFVIGNRVKYLRERGSMLPQQIIGNKLAVFLIKLFHKFRYYDLGPFRAIKYNALLTLNMEDKTYGWTVEMQIKALKHKLKIAEIPVHYRKRIGKSKISGTIKGTIMAGIKIIKTIFKYR